MRIGYELFAYREAHELSQRELAELLGLSENYVTQIENGREPGAKARSVIEKFLKKN